MIDQILSVVESHAWLEDAFLSNTFDLFLQQGFHDEIAEILDMDTDDEEFINLCHAAHQIVNWEGEEIDDLLLSVKEHLWEYLPWVLAEAGKVAEVIDGGGDAS